MVIGYEKPTLVEDYSSLSGSGLLQTGQSLTIRLTRRLVPHLVQITLQSSDRLFSMLLNDHISFFVQQNLELDKIKTCANQEIEGQKSSKSLKPNRSFYDSGIVSQIER
jgi:hypothetical protein